MGGRRGRQILPPHPSRDATWMQRSPASKRTIVSLRKGGLGGKPWLPSEACTGAEAQRPQAGAGLRPAEFSNDVVLSARHRELFVDAVEHDEPLRLAFRTAALETADRRAGDEAVAVH